MTLYEKILRLIRHPLTPSSHAFLPLSIRRVLNIYMRRRGDPPTDRGRTP